VPAANFATALTTTLTGRSQLSFANLKTAVAGLDNNSALYKSVKPLLDKAEATAANADQQLRAALANVEGWYDAAMDHASRWYKRKVRWSLLFLGGAIAVIANADTFQVAFHLADDGQLRATVAALALQVGTPDNKSTQEFQKLQNNAGSPRAARSHRRVRLAAGRVEPMPGIVDHRLPRLQSRGDVTGSQHAAEVLRLAADSRCGGDGCALLVWVAAAGQRDSRRRTEARASTSAQA
jgi:hypothetical protein